MFGYCSFLFVPVIWAVVIPLDIVYSLWFFNQKARLPYRLPASWRKKDYSNPEPGSNGRFRKGEGLLFLGNDYDSNEELWISNEDARRHALVLGTTGSGKSLTSDTLVLGEFGWVTIGKLEPGNRIRTPSGSLTKVSGVFPQGKLPVVRIHFEDGRWAECSRDHLWLVKRHVEVDCLSTDEVPKWETMSAGDLGIQLETGRLSGSTKPLVRYFIPLVNDIPGTGGKLNKLTFRNHATKGMSWKIRNLDQKDSASERKEWLLEFLTLRNKTKLVEVIEGSLKIPVVSSEEGIQLRYLIWSLGGLALQLIIEGRIYIKASIPGLNKTSDGHFVLTDKYEKPGLEIVEVEGFYSRSEALVKKEHIKRQVALGTMTPQQGDELIKSFKVLEKDMTCIKVESAEGLFVMESYLVTHNSEFLLGLVSQSIMWNSGFLFVDGKGTTEFHGRTWSLVSKFGREDDYRILNFTDLGGKQDNRAGGPDVQSNTLNPFSHGTPDQLMNLIVSLMGNAAGGSDMWKHRAMSLVTSAIRAL
ncbi:MAG: hypothetical protein F4044_08105, partial [Rhodobacteraceae bacterium]|nr:hypothetical protein [Paracoccaceae bacterium]